MLIVISRVQAVIGNITTDSDSKIRTKLIIFSMNFLFSISMNSYVTHLLKCFRNETFFTFLVFDYYMHPTTTVFPICFQLCRAFTFRLYLTKTSNCLHTCSASFVQV